jgi:hypothetical protein
MRKTEAEKKAEQIVKLISDVSLDLDEVGISIARMKPVTHYNRLINITEAAEWEMAGELERLENLERKGY